MEIHEQHIILLKILFLGALLSMAIYVLFRYFFQKDKAALYYVLYAVVLILAFTFQLDRYPAFYSLRFPEPSWNYITHNELVNLAFIIYFFFASYFLDGKRRYPRINKVILMLARANLAIWIMHMVLAITVPIPLILTSLHYLEFALIMIMGVTGLIVILRHHSYLERLLVAGVSVLLLAGFYKLYLLISGTTGLPAPYTILMICVLAELFIYAAAIGYKTRREQQMAIIYNKTLIKELELNRSLQQELRDGMIRYQEQLESTVNERTSEILKQSNVLQEEKLRKSMEAYRRMSLERELKGLRAHMNPHFLFNCMNMLSSFVMNNQKEEAIDIIQQFSLLLRLVLNNSKHPQVTIEEEIKTLKLYVGLEAIRYNHSFHYEFKIEPELLSDDYKIPPMLLQPFVENAIRNILSNPEPGKGQLKVTLYSQQHYIICEISDNGVRREMSEENPELNTESDVTLTKINLAKELYKEDASVEVIDLTGPERGSTVKIKIPA